MIEADEIRRLIEERIEGATVLLEDFTGGQDHWSATVISPAFDGLSRVRQHQLVYEPLAEALHERLHALQLKTLTPDQARERGLLAD